MEIWYSVRNGGDGSAYPVFMESEAQAELDQDNMSEGWGESCTGCIKLESDSPITVKSGMVSIATQIAELKDDLKHSWTDKATAQKHLSGLQKLQERGTD